LKWACDDHFVASASADGFVCVTSLAESRLEPLLLLLLLWATARFLTR
jgi:hypothetical protein